MVQDPGGTSGFIPNLLAVMASEPPLLEAYMSLNAIFEKCNLSVSERQLVLLTVSQASGCKYCLAAHSAIAAMHHVDADKIAAARDGRPTGEAKLDALLTFTREVTSTRGNPSAVATNRMATAGIFVGSDAGRDCGSWHEDPVELHKSHR